MTTKSHVDLCMFIQILEVDEGSVPDNLVPLLLSRDYRAIQQYLSARGSGGLKFLNRDTQLHESIHVIQSIIYPFLRWYGHGRRFARIRSV